MMTTDELKQDFGIEAAAIILVCRVFIGTSAEKELDTFIHANKIDWALFYKLSSIHQLRPVVFKVLYKFDVPADIIQQLQADCRRIAIHNLEHAKELVRVYELLDKAGIIAIPYKGSVFCLEYYKDIGLREFSDIDFLINLNIKDLKTIKSIFESLGYIDKSDVPDDFKETHFRHTREYYFDLYENEERKFHTEFHWSTASQLFDFPTLMPNAVLFTDLNESNIFGKKIKTLNATHHFIAMATHHGLNQRWSLIKYIMDLAMLLKNGAAVDWEEITATSKTYGFNKSVNIGLYIADNLLGIKPGVVFQSPKSGRRYLDELLSSSSKKRKGTGEALLLNLKIKDNFASQLKMVYKYIQYAATPSILDYKFLKLPRRLFFLYGIIKPIRMASDYLKKS